MSIFRSDVPIVNRACFMREETDHSVFHADISELAPINVNGWQFLYHEGYPVKPWIGFAIRARDGGLAYFYIVSEERDADDDIIVWHLAMTAESSYQYPHGANVHLVIFND